MASHALAGCLLGGAGAVVSHHTALALHGLGPPPLLPHVAVPPSASGRTPLARIHRTAVPTVDRGRVDGGPCTSVARTLLDVAGLIERSALEEVVDSTFADRRAAPESVLATLGRAAARGGGPLGAPLLREAIEVWHGDIQPDSPAEARFLRQLRTYGCDDAVPQYVVRDADGIFVARLDVAVPGRCVGYEYDSVRFHNPRRYDADEVRDARLEALRWTIHHVSKRDLLPGDTRIRDLVRCSEAA